MARKNLTRLQGLVNGFMASRGTFHLHFVVGVVGRLEVGLFFFSSLSLSIVSSVNSFFELMVTLYEVKIDVFVKHYCGLLSMFDFHER
jgi:hypothetical protein